MSEDAYVVQQIRLENLKAGEAREVVKLLEAVHEDLIAVLPKQGTDWSRERYARILAAYSDAVDSLYANGVLPKLEQDGLSFVVRNLRIQVQNLEEEAAESTLAAQFRAAHENGELVTSSVSANAIHTAALSKPFEGKIMQQWANELSRTEKTQISNALRVAWVEGEGLDKAAARISPIMRQSRNNIATITRTYYGHLATETRTALWDQNSDIIEHQLWDSVLDNRTTADICGPRDQLAYTLKQEPIDHSLPWLGGPGQAHWNCRSAAYPIVKGVKRNVQRPAVVAGSNYERGDNLTRTGRVRKNLKTNRDKGIYKETTVREGTTWLDVMRRQPKAYQEDVFGVVKAKAFRDGSWTPGERFVAPNPQPLVNY